MQCKGKDRDFGGTLTEPELRREVAAAKTFEPPLSSFVLATTAPNDVAIQAVARELTEGHRPAGLFEVQVYGWEELRQLIAAHPSVLEIHYPDLAPTLPRHIKLAVEAGMEDALQRRDRTDERMLEQTMGLMVAELDRRLPVPDNAEAERPPTPRAAANDELGLRITAVADLLGEAPPTVVIRALQALWDSSAGEASDWNRYRLQANLGAAFWQNGDAAAAAAAYRAAHGEQQDAGAGLSALAMAELIENDAPAAFAHAAASLALDPSSERAANLLLWMPLGLQGISDLMDM